MDLEARFRVPAKGFKLSEYDPGDSAGLDKKASESLRAADLERLTTLQERLYAESRQSLLVVVQAMDAAGKDGTIAHVMTGVNPQGVRVTSFKQPSHVELAHDWLWRCSAGDTCRNSFTTRVRQAPRWRSQAAIASSRVSQNASPASAGSSPCAARYSGCTRVTSTSS